MTGKTENKQTKNLALCVHPFTFTHSRVGGGGCRLTIFRLNPSRQKQLDILRRHASAPFIIAFYSILWYTHSTDGRARIILEAAASADCTAGQNQHGT